MHNKYSRNLYHKCLESSIVKQRLWERGLEFLAPRPPGMLRYNSCDTLDFCIKFLMNDLSSEPDTPIQHSNVERAASSMKN
ncbi:unnamed protein product [Pieris brassicae]|uniref:Uncharacterized protein n=1 Tax=Pieris brassicae TaxID=7116 RepID=A0A9P0T4A5_PIEBR|nr:unnamed protein product [Pieris brassicae]